MSRKIVILAGEESGDVLGGRLIHALKAQGDFAITGVGGTTMMQNGMDSLFPMQDLSVMGLIEIMPRLPLLIKRIRQTVRHIIHTQPDIVVTIDSPDFCKRVVKKARKKCPRTKFIHYVAPTVWAWRQGRAKTMAEIFDGLICLFPFEPSYFERHGLKAQYCGHPVIETFAAIPPQSRLDDHILILPGSRKGEIKRMAPVFAETFKRLHALNPSLEGRIVALPHLKEMIEEHFLGMNVTYVSPDDRYQAFMKAPFALATSGTVGLELAVAECPHIIAYKTNPLTWWILKRMVRVKYAHLANIMEDREVIPECLQDQCNPDAILKAMEDYGTLDLSRIYYKIVGGTPDLPSVQAARFVTLFY